MFLLRPATCSRQAPREWPAYGPRGSKQHRAMAIGTGTGSKKIGTWRAGSPARILGVIFCVFNTNETSLVFLSFF